MGHECLDKPRSGGGPTISVKTCNGTNCYESRGMSIFQAQGTAAVVISHGLPSFKGNPFVSEHGPSKVRPTANLDSKRGNSEVNKLS